MEEILIQMKTLFAGKWIGEGFAAFHTIDDTAYTEEMECIADEYKEAIFYRQKTWYKNNTAKNGHTVFWDTGFIILKQGKVLLNSVQAVGRIEMYTLEEVPINGQFIFNSISILNDPLSVQSQRVFTVDSKHFTYEMNLGTKDAGFQNHLKGHLTRVSF